MATLYRPKPVAGAEDFEILHPEVSVPVAGELWTVREYSVQDGARCAHVARKVLKQLDSGEAAGPELVRLLALAVDRDLVRVAGLSDEDFQTLVDAWRKVNVAWFSDERKARSRRGKPRRWSTVYATLIARGHDVEQIGKYTLRQIQLYLDEADRADRHARADRIVDFNLGYNGGREANRMIALLQRELPL